MSQLKHACGLVLSELVVALIVTSLVALGIATQLRGSVTASAQALAMYNTTQKMAANWNAIAASCGAESDVSPSLLPEGNKTATDVLILGEAAVNPRFLNCYQQSHTQLLTDPIQVTSSGPQIQHYNFILSGGGTAPFVAQFAAVPPEVAYALATRYGNLQQPSLLPSDTTSPHIRYWPDSQNTYAVQIRVGASTQPAAAPVPMGTTPGAPVTPPAVPAPPSPAPTGRPPAILPPPTAVVPGPLSSPSPSAPAPAPSVSLTPASTSPSATTPPPAATSPTTSANMAPPPAPAYTFNPADLCTAFPGGAFAVGQPMAVPNALSQAMFNNNNSGITTILGPTAIVSRPVISGATRSLNIEIVNASIPQTYNWHVSYNSQTNSPSSWSYACNVQSGASVINVFWNADQDGNFTSFNATTGGVTNGNAGGGTLNLQFSPPGTISSVYMTGYTAFFVQ